MIKEKQKTFFRNKIITKKYLQEILFWCFKNFGMARAAFLADSLKKLGFSFATKAGISISIEDLKVPKSKNNYIKKTNQEIKQLEFDLNSGKITEIEKYEQLTNNWNITSEKLKNKIVNFLENFDPLNPIYMIAFSGARGNLSQVKQLIGIRGLMAGPSGNIIDIPITKNFREGLSSTDYMISAYGARKGLVDTALKTADSGYLTRRLIDIAQDVLIRETECYANQGIYLFKLDNKKGKIINLRDRVLGRILAKDIIDLQSKQIIGFKNQQINSLILKKIEEYNLSSIIVRSPLTCQLTRSICKNCYGSNLSNGKLVDLGEAVGIVAAQSIGEPGTQLTMRTFHTGGIFSSNSNYQIFSKVSGQIIFPKQLKTISIRTSEGKNALIIETSTIIELITFKNKVIKIFLKKNTILFVNNKEFIKKNQLVASLENFEKIEKIEKKILSSPISGEIILNKGLNKINLNLTNHLEKEMKERLIWIFSSKVLNIPFSAKLTKYKFSYLNNLRSIASSKLISYKSGSLKIPPKYDLNKTNINKIKLLIENFTIENCNLYYPIIQNRLLNKNYKYLILSSFSENKFFYPIKELKFFNEEYIRVGQLINNKFKTKISGTIYFLKIKTNLINPQSKTYNLNSGGGAVCLAEEIFNINKDVSSIFVKNGSWVKSNIKITRNFYNKKPGFAKTMIENKIVRKIIVKLGYYITLSKHKKIDLTFNKRLLFKGEKIFYFHQIKQLTYSEIIKTYKKTFLFFRPLHLYEIPTIKFVKSKFLIKNPTECNYTTFKNKDRIIINKKSINLIKTNLVFLNTQNLFKNLRKKLSVNLIKKNNFSLNCNIFENIFSEVDLLKNFNNVNYKISFFVKDNQYIEPYSIIGNIEFFTNILGKINNLKEIKQIKFRRILISLPENYQKIFLENKTKVNKNFITTKSFLSKNLIVLNSGLIKKFSNNKLEIFLAKSFLFSNGAEIFWSKKDLIEEKENLGVLLLKKTQTGDIVQGLPKIEEILEARTPKKDNSILQNFYLNTEFNIFQTITFNVKSPHNRLKLINNFYRKFLDNYQAAYKSLRKIQSYLLNSIQDIYFSQGVIISDKHLEIIIKQMTSKVKIEEKGDIYLLGIEYIDLQQIYTINKVLKKTKSQEIIYKPSLLGITKASLTSESFISASSFQETVRILTAASIKGKVDWLRGLKENVIIGRLIPAGTGFNSYEQFSYLKLLFPDISLSK